MSSRGFEVESYKQVDRGALRGMFSVRWLLPSDESVVTQGWRLMQQQGKEPWVSVPQQEYQQNGERRFKNLMEVSQELKDAILESALRAARVTDEPDSDDLGAFLR